jgi:Restriction endonuclease
MSDFDFREYENGVADVLAFLAGESAEVERNVRLPSRSNSRARQIDVVVRGRIFGMADATMVVDCKRHKAPVDVKAIESFIGFVEDVGADIGLLVTSSGTTESARSRASAERGVRLEVLALDELVRWSPAGTVATTYGLPADHVSAAQAALRKAGVRVRDEQAYEAQDGELLVTAFRHYGQAHPSADIQQQFHETTQGAFRKLGLEPRHVASGVTMAGGTPGHRWLEVTAAGVPSGIKVIAATEAEAEAQLDRVATTFAQAGIPREALSYVKPEDWPVTTMFGL